MITSSTNKRQCHIFVSIVSFVILVPLVVLNFHLENVDDVFIKNHGSWIDALMTYTPRDGRHIISFLNLGLYHLGFTFKAYQIFCSITFVASLIYLINTIISLVEIDTKPFESIFFAVSSILFPFMFDFYQWTSAYLIYSVGFACIGTAFLCFPRIHHPWKIFICGSLIALSACAYQPLILLPFVVLALCVFFKDLPKNLTSIPTQCMLLVSSLGLYFLYNEILKRIWELFAPKVFMQRTLALHNLPLNLPQQIHSTYNIFFSTGAYHNLIYKPLALLLFCVVVSLVVIGLVKFDLKKTAFAIFLILTIPTPIILLQPPESYWPAPRVSFYINFIFTLGLLAVLKNFHAKKLMRYGLSAVLILVGGNAFSILHHRWLQDKLDEKNGYAIINQINARSDRPLIIAINPNRIQNWTFNSYELGGTIFWASYAITPYMDALAKKHFEQDQITFERDDGKACPQDASKIPAHTLCPRYN